MRPGLELADTPPEAMRQWIEANRKLTVEERLRALLELIELGDAMLRENIAREQPGLSERNFQWELARRKYGREVADEHFPREDA